MVAAAVEVEGGGLFDLKRLQFEVETKLAGCGRGRYGCNTIRSNSSGLLPLFSTPRIPTGVCGLDRLTPLLSADADAVLPSRTRVAVRRRRVWRPLELSEELLLFRLIREGLTEEEPDRVKVMVFETADR